MQREIVFEAHNRFHQDNLPKIIFRTNNYTEFADILDRYFISAFYTQYSYTNEVTLDLIRISTIVHHIDDAIFEYERVNPEFVEGNCDPELPHCIVKYKDHEFVASIDEDIYSKLKEMSNTLHNIFDNGFNWDRYNVTAVCYEA